MVVAHPMAVTHCGKMGRQRFVAGTGARGNLPPWPTVVGTNRRGDGGSRAYIKGGGGRRPSTPAAAPTSPAAVPLQVCFLSFFS
jgi:hypothetical protein